KYRMVFLQSLFSERMRHMKRFVKLLFALTSLFLAFSSLGVKIVLAQQADLSISQRIFKHQDLNGVTTFAIAVTNNGPASATQVVVNTTLNSSWDFDDPSGQHHLSSGLLNWT